MDINIRFGRNSEVRKLVEEAVGFKVEDMIMTKCDYIPILDIVDITIHIQPTRVVEFIKRSVKPTNRFCVGGM